MAAMAATVLYKIRTPCGMLATLQPGCQVYEKQPSTYSFPGPSILASSHLLPPTSIFLNTIFAQSLGEGGGGRGTRSQGLIDHVTMGRGEGEEGGGRGPRNQGLIDHVIMIFKPAIQSVTNGNNKQKAGVIPVHSYYMTVNSHSTSGVIFSNRLNS